MWWNFHVNRSCKSRFGSSKFQRGALALKNWAQVVHGGQAMHPTSWFGKYLAWIPYLLNHLSCCKSSSIKIPSFRTAFFCHMLYMFPCFFFFARKETLKQNKRTPFSPHNIRPYKSMATYSSTPDFWWLVTRNPEANHYQGLWDVSLAINRFLTPLILKRAHVQTNGFEFHAQLSCTTWHDEIIPLVAELNLCIPTGTWFLPPTQENSSSSSSKTSKKRQEANLCPHQSKWRWRPWRPKSKISNKNIVIFFTTDGRNPANHLRFIKPCK